MSIPSQVVRGWCKERVQENHIQSRSCKTPHHITNERIVGLAWTKQEKHRKMLLSSATDARIEKPQDAKKAHRPSETPTKESTAPTVRKHSTSNVPKSVANNDRTSGLSRSGHVTLATDHRTRSEEVHIKFTAINCKQETKSTLPVSKKPRESFWINHCQFRLTIPSVNVDCGKLHGSRLKEGS